MAFDFFKKKEKFEYPNDEKEEILAPPELPELPEMPKLPKIPPMPPTQPTLEEFRRPEELKPPVRMPPEAREIMTPSIRPPKIPTGLPPFERPEPIPMPKSKPMAVETRPFGEVRAGAPAPHMYIRIGKYREVMEVIEKLRKKITETKRDLEDIHSIGGEERDKLRESAEVILKIEEPLRYLETTFSVPED